MDNKPVSAEGQSPLPGEHASLDPVRPYSGRNIFSFIIKIWVDQAYSGTWHGYISGVPNGNGRYFRSFSQIGRFISAYLLTAGIRIAPVWLARIREWFRSAGKHPPEHSA